MKKTVVRGTGSPQAYQDSSARGLYHSRPLRSNNKLEEPIGLSKGQEASTLSPLEHRGLLFPSKRSRSNVWSGFTHTFHSLYFSMARLMTGCAHSVPRHGWCRPPSRTQKTHSAPARSIWQDWFGPCNGFPIQGNILPGKHFVPGEVFIHVLGCLNLYGSQLLSTRLTVCC